ncbi:MAG TPA: hypothetical protein VFW12_07490 [Candidatus Limnocylindria bacterium]|nr:hypothetical protein [Candidatus Limnocylindria bacterium]
MTARGSLALVVAFTAFWVIALPLDRATTEPQQQLLGLAAWAFLIAALVRQPPGVRAQVIVLVCVATALEIVGSVVWRAYVYRLENLPLYVPAGHGLFYLAALHASSLPLLARNAHRVVTAVGLLSTVWMAWGLLRPPVPDMLGFVTWAIFIRFLARGRYPLLYSVSFVMTMALEVYGTRLGIWTWAPLLPGLWLPAGNPPTGIGAGYAAMDALSRRILGTVIAKRPLRARRAGSLEPASDEPAAA